MSTTALAVECHQSRVLYAPSNFPWTPSSRVRSRPLEVQRNLASIPNPDAPSLPLPLAESTR